jgi:signal transduction histidine kinase
MAELLLEGQAGELSTQQTNLVRRIHANIRRVISLSLNLLDAARIESGRLNLQRTPVNLGEVVEDALSMARSAGDLKGVALRITAEPGLPKVDIDFMQMERVVSNLLDNAIKYTPTGGMVTVMLNAAADHLVLTVRDNGPGITPQEMPSLFEKYRRHANSGRNHGSGLGLFIVKAIVEAHGGSVEADSVVGKGTTMRVRIPTMRAQAAEPRELVATVPEPSWWESAWRRPSEPSAVPDAFVDPGGPLA